MSNTSKAVDVLTKMIVEVAQNATKNASYDKTTFGVVKKKTPSGYIVSAFGKECNIQSNQDFSLYERVAVTAPQGDYSNLLIRKI